jgi:hypothetical protein
MVFLSNLVSFLRAIKTTRTVLRPGSTLQCDNHAYLVKSLADPSHRRETDLRCLRDGRIIPGRPNLTFYERHTLCDAVLDGHRGTVRRPRHGFLWCYLPLLVSV